MVTVAERAQELTAAVAAEPAAGESALLVLCRLCVVELSVTDAALVLRSSAGLDPVVAVTDGTAAAVEDLQFDLGEGPGVDAARDGPVLTPDLTAASDRWPLFAPAAAGAGVAAVFAFPVRAGRVTIGVLDLYRDTPGELTDQALPEAAGWAAAAADVVLALQAQARPPAELHPQLTGVTADRAEIHQATGMIYAQTGVSPVEALPLLRAHAYTTGRSMLAVCRDVLTHRIRFDRDQPA